VRVPLRSVRFSFSPARFPVFYGWVIAVVGTIGVLASVPGQTMGVSVFTDHLLGVLVIDRVGLTEAYMYGTILSSFLLPAAGKLYDRKGARYMVVLSSLGLALTLVYLSYCDGIVSMVAKNLESFDTSRWAIEIGVLTFGFFLVRFWGQGVLTMVSRTMIGKWFQVRRGLVIGLCGVVMALCFSASPRWLSSLVDVFGWRRAWLALALCIGIGMTAIGWLFYRDTPEECGLLMDGRKPNKDETGRELSVETSGELHFTVSQALRTYPFWVFNLTLALPALVVTALTFHIEDVGRKEGMLLAETIQIFPSMAVFSVVTSLAGGWLSDRIRVKYLFGFLALTQALGSLGLLAFGTEAGRWLVATGYGISGGLFGLLIGVIWPRFYGRAHLGAICSLNMSVVVFASAIGPWVFAISEEKTGGYTAAGIACIVLALVCLVASMGIANPQREPESTEA
jgi:OFA family oxalate/formate antiporter-like MFS transporter